MARENLEDARRSVRRSADRRRDWRASRWPRRWRGWRGRSRRIRGVPVRVEADGTSSGCRCATESELYRIAQEALANVRKHAHAQHVWRCRCASAGAAVTLCRFATTGAGFRRVRRCARPDSHGLVGMRERAKLLGGTLTVISRAGSRHARGRAAVASRLVGDDDPRAGRRRPPDRAPGAGIGARRRGPTSMSSARQSRDARQSRWSQRLQPDVVLLDLEMPELDGVDAIPLLLAAHPTLGVLVFTAYDTDDRVLGAIRAGARGYLLKGASARRDRARHTRRSRLAGRTSSRA